MVSNKARRGRGDGITLPADYEERVYAGVLGKIVGVYLGRPIEGWRRRDIEARFGDVRYYVHEKLGASLVVADDDISGTFTFLRALADHDSGHALTAAEIGDTWLNYLIENRTVLWWGGLGMSTEHTAYLRLKQGIRAPESGSIERNGAVVAEQIGAQIFIDGWAMVCPGDPEKAVALAGKAASVSHDGEAVCAAQVLAAMESLAFVQPSIPKLIETAATFIAPGSLIYRLIRDVCAWHAEEPHDWRAAFRRVEERYGYDKFGGVCHVVPNHAVILTALLYSEDSFHKALTIANTAGWDTDCNSGNVGCLMGIKNGLAGLDTGPDFRGPVADRMYLPTADGARCATDALTEAYRVIDAGRALQGLAPAAPKEGMRCHFSLPGAVQGFVPDDSPESRGACRVENVAASAGALKDLTSGGGDRMLAIRYAGIAPGRAARVATSTFPWDVLSRPGSGYALVASPSLYPGQTVRARVLAADGNRVPVETGLYVRLAGRAEGDDLLRGAARRIAPGGETHCHWELPDTDGHPIAEVGVEVRGDSGTGTLLLDWLHWDGAPQVSLGRSAHGSDAWLRAWVNAADRFDAGDGSESAGVYRLIRNEGPGFAFQGDYAWSDYTVQTAVRPHLCDEIGLLAAVRGLRRYVALTLRPDGILRLLLRHDGEETVLAEAPVPWRLEHPYTMSITVRRSGDIVATVEDGAGPAVLEAAIPDDRARGAVGLLVRAGHGQFGALQVGGI